MTVRESYQIQEKSIFSNVYLGESKMSASRKTAVIVGLFYIAATAAGIMSVYFMPDLTAPNSITQISTVINQVFIAGLLEFTMAVFIAGIAIGLYPILKKQNEPLAIGYLVARIVEAVIYTIGVISLYTLTTLGLEFVTVSGADAGTYQALSTLLHAGREWGGAVFATFAFSLSALLLNGILYRARLVPRWLSAWGFIGAILYFASSFLPLLGQDSSSVGYGLMQLVIGLQEMVFAIWLIVKGFTSVEIVPEYAMERV